MRYFGVGIIYSGWEEWYCPRVVFVGVSIMFFFFFCYRGKNCGEYIVVVFFFFFFGCKMEK